MIEENKISFTEAEFARISLNPGEVLCVKIVSDEIPDENTRILHDKLTSLFPNNKIMLFVMPIGSDINLTAIKNPDPGCGPQTCADCNCGKAERNA